MLSAVMADQCFACIWQFHVAPLESWATLLTRGSNDEGQDQMQAKIRLYEHMYAYIEA